MPYRYGHPGFPVGRAIFIVVLLVALAAAVVAIYLMLRDRLVDAKAPAAGAGVAPSSDALRILDERFARGEIDDDEYQRRRQLLRSSA